MVSSFGVVVAVCGEVPVVVATCDGGGGGSSGGV